MSFRGAVPTPLPLLPCVVLQSAIKFINLTVPSSAGRIGINVRFLQRVGAPTPQAFAAGAVDDLSEKIVEIALVLLTLPLVHIAVKAGDLNGGMPPRGGARRAVGPGRGALRGALTFPLAGRNRPAARRSGRRH